MVRVLNNSNTHVLLTYLRGLQARWADELPLVLIGMGWKILIELVLNVLDRFACKLDGVDGLVRQARVEQLARCLQVPRDRTGSTDTWLRIGAIDPKYRTSLQGFYESTRKLLR
jgi:hypothetical protein